MLSIYVFEATNECFKFACCLPVGEYLDTTLCLCNLTGHPYAGARVTRPMLSIRDGTSDSGERLVRLTSGFRTRPARGPAEAPGTNAGRSCNQHTQENSQYAAQTRGTPAAALVVVGCGSRRQPGDSREAGHSRAGFGGHAAEDDPRQAVYAHHDAAIHDPVDHAQGRPGEVDRR